MRYIVEINFPQNVQISCFLPGEVQLNALYLIINDHFKAIKWINESNFLHYMNIKPV